MDNRLIQLRKNDVGDIAVVDILNKRKNQEIVKNDNFAYSGEFAGIRQ